MHCVEPAYLGLRRVAADDVVSLAIEGRVSEGGPQGRVAKACDRSHCECVDR